MKISPLLLLSLLVLYSNWVVIIWPSMAMPLYTNSRWVVDEGGRRVKLACVNWSSHLEVMAAEGLNKQPLDSISKRIGTMGFNCVRLTWPLFMVTNNTLGSTTFRKSLQNLGLVESIAGVQVNNPGLLDLPVLQVFQVTCSFYSWIFLLISSPTGGTIHTLKILDIFFSYAPLPQFSETTLCILETQGSMLTLA